jgi:hypothetical protein
MKIAREIIGLLGPYRHYLKGIDYPQAQLNLLLPIKFHLLIPVVLGIPIKIDYAVRILEGISDFIIEGQSKKLTLINLLEDQRKFIWPNSIELYCPLTEKFWALFGFK